MAKVAIPYPLRKHVDNQKSVSIDGSNLKEVIDTLLETYSGLKESFKSMDFMYIFVNGKRVLKDAEDWGNISIKEDDDLALVLPIAGGRL